MYKPLSALLWAATSAGVKDLDMMVDVVCVVVCGDRWWWFVMRWVSGGVDM
jgi:hypothetical protein